MRIARVAFIVAGTLGAAFASGQTPCPCPPATPPPPPLWSGEVGVSYLGTSGNTSTSSFGGNFGLKWLPDPWALEAKFAFLRSESEHVVTAEAYDGSVTAARSLTKRLDVYGGSEYHRNVFAGIDYRINATAGVGYKVLDGPVTFLRPEVGFGYEKRKQVDVGTDSYPVGRAGLKFLWKFSAGGEFANETSFTDDLNETDNWVFRNKATVSAKLTNVFQLRLGWGIEYNNLPNPGPPPFKKTDTVTSAAIVAKF
jgi:putative salt-induced outer membrane protein